MLWITISWQCLSNPINGLQWRSSLSRLSIWKWCLCSYDQLFTLSHVYSRCSCSLFMCRSILFQSDEQTVWIRTIGKYFRCRKKSTNIFLNARKMKQDARLSLIKWKAEVNLLSNRSVLMIIENRQRRNAFKLESILINSIVLYFIIVGKINTMKYWNVQVTFISIQKHSCVRLPNWYYPFIQSHIQFIVNRSRSIVNTSQSWEQTTKLVRIQKTFAVVIRLALTYLSYITLTCI